MSAGTTERKLVLLGDLVNRSTIPGITCATLGRCQDCNALWWEATLERVKDLEARVDPGEPMPIGECRNCGALCQPERHPSVERPRTWFEWSWPLPNKGRDTFETLKLCSMRESEDSDRHRLRLFGLLPEKDDMVFLHEFDTLAEAAVYLCLAGLAEPATYVVSGRLYGDDDDTVEIVQALPWEDPTDIFAHSIVPGYIPLNWREVWECDPLYSGWLVVVHCSPVNPLKGVRKEGAKTLHLINEAGNIARH